MGGGACKLFGVGGTIAGYPVLVATAAVAARESLKTKEPERWRIMGLDTVAGAFSGTVRTHCDRREMEIPFPLTPDELRTALAMDPVTVIDTFGVGWKLRYPRASETVKAARQARIARRERCISVGLTMCQEDPELHKRLHAAVIAAPAGKIAAVVDEFYLRIGEAELAKTAADGDSIEE